MLGKFKFPVLGEGERNVILECCGKRIQGVVFIISRVALVCPRKQPRLCRRVIPKDRIPSLRGKKP